nr:immunoglobulin heavy chain junction region [Macaca mulatta]MOV47412.1 immunoglobulin heavy chain junction region [Macaca mulatta]MOV47438.1 immunoglobulin heavy chain junction region [Macaca mulatta]MOV47445.1 immunoglobulin heavy chain junction region [Macaca mulatta]MOV47460.1 immunoglobulin heavy chain junction region [Macaca mulatta]
CARERVYYGIGYEGEYFEFW